MKFRTEYIARRSVLTLSPQEPIVLLGSCFASNMASRMEASLWDAVSPCGALYNPLSIARALRVMLLAADPEREFRNSLFERNGVWHSFLFDSSFSRRSAEECVAAFNTARERLDAALSEGKVMCVTFGTSWCYFLSSDIPSDLKLPFFPAGELVANCHKLPATCFIRRRIGIDEIAEEWNSLLEELGRRYGGLQVIFTVSPIRHLKDGMEGNTLSKATLHLAIESLLKERADSHYFPAYEILLDDLRDYRFYASDLAHPSEEAADYIWEAFQATFLDATGIKLLQEGAKLHRALHHRSILETPEERDARLSEVRARIDIRRGKGAKK